MNIYKYLNIELTQLRLSLIHISFGRLGRAEEVTPVVLLLLSPLSSYITGSSVDIDGGLNIHWK